MTNKEEKRKMKLEKDLKRIKEKDDTAVIGFVIGYILFFILLLMLILLG